MIWRVVVLCGLLLTLCSCSYIEQLKGEEITEMVPEPEPIVILVDPLPNQDSMPQINKITIQQSGSEEVIVKVFDSGAIHFGHLDAVNESVNVIKSITPVGVYTLTEDGSGRVVYKEDTAAFSKEWETRGLYASACLSVATKAEYVDSMRSGIDMRLDIDRFLPLLDSFYPEASVELAKGLPAITSYITLEKEVPIKNNIQIAFPNNDIHITIETMDDYVNYDASELPLINPSELVEED